jgi:hypothetical protein
MTPSTLDARPPRRKAVYRTPAQRLPAAGERQAKRLARPPRESVAQIGSLLLVLRSVAC